MCWTAIESRGDETISFRHFNGSHSHANAWERAVTLCGKDPDNQCFPLRNVIAIVPGLHTAYGSDGIEGRVASNNFQV